MSRLCPSIPKIDTNSQAFTVFPTNEYSTNSLVFNSGASTHMMNDLGKICFLLPYCGLDTICVENGAELPIKFGYSVIPTSSHNLVLKDVLVSPGLTKNLVFIQKLTVDNNCIVEFTPSGFCVKDLQTKNKILSSSSQASLYPLHGSIN